MKKKSIRVMAIVLAFVLIGSMSTISQAVGNEPIFLQKELEQIKNIEEQLTSMLQAGYLNVVNGKSNKGLISSTGSYNTQIRELEEALNEAQNTPGITTDQVYKILSLKRAVDYLSFLDKNLIEYLKAKDSLEQFEILKKQILVDGLLNQIIIYVEDAQEIG